MHEIWRNNFHLNQGWFLCSSLVGIFFFNQRLNRNTARFFSLFLEIEFNALRFINDTIPRLCSTYAVATLGRSEM